MQKVFIVLQLIKYIVAEIAVIDPNILNHENKKLISHGELFDIQKYPFMVYFESKIFAENAISTCTGSLILPLFVLTAAHCTHEAYKYDIVVIHISNIMQ